MSNAPLFAVARKPVFSTITSARTAVLQRQCDCGQHTAGGECEECKKRNLSLQRKPDTQTESGVAPAIVHEVLCSPGKPLDQKTRAFFEPHFGHDFSRVRLHTDTMAAESARSVNASAYTVGDHIVFQSGHYDASSVSGRGLLAHELAHVVQNRKSGAQTTGPLEAISHPADASEQEAAGAAQRVMNGSRVSINGPATGVIHRDLPDVAARAGALDSKAKALARKLQILIDGATWKEIRKRVYPQQSAAGIKRAKQRKAGKLQDLTGLGRIKTLEHFAAAIRNIQKSWNTTPDNRIKMLGNAARTELVAADVPGFLLVDKLPMEFKGFFTPSQWKFTISQDLVTNATLNDIDAAEVANTTMHESRHAEQHFLAARFAAGLENKDSSTIASEHSIPGTIADQAVAKKFDAHTAPAVVSLGRQMNKAMIVEGVQNQAISDDDGLADLATKRSEAQAALQTLKASPTVQTIANATAKHDALRAQITVVEQKYGLYRNIPYEADAHEVGDAAGEAFNRWPK